MTRKIRTNTVYIALAVTATTVAMLSPLWEPALELDSEPPSAATITAKTSNDPLTKQVSLPLSHSQDVLAHTAHESADSEQNFDKDKIRALLTQYAPPALNTDVNGDLIIDQQLRLFLEHFTHWLGLEGIQEEQLFELTHEYLETLYQDDLLSEVRAMFDRYWAYNKKLNALMNAEDIASAKGEFDGHYRQEQTLNLLSEFHELRDTLRQSHFTPDEKEAFFGEDDRYDAFFKQSLADGHTDHAELLLSERQLEQRKQSRVLLDLERLQRDSGAQVGSIEWEQTIKETYEQDTAQKILQISAKEHDWQQKKESYLSRKDNLNSVSSLSDQDMAIELDRIMREELSFTDFEVRRMQALEGRFQQTIN